MSWLRRDQCFHRLVDDFPAAGVERRRRCAFRGRDGENGRRSGGGGQLGVELGGGDVGVSEHRL